MPGFLLAVGDKHQSVTSKVMDNKKFDQLLGMGRPSLKQRTDRLTLLEWSCEHEKFESDLCFADCKNTGHVVILSGYITFPEPIYGKKCIDNSSALLTIAQRISSEPFQQANSLNALNGSFTILSIKSKDNTINLYSDRFGSRTIWRTYHERTWLFASHPVYLWLAIGGRYSIEPASLGSLLLRARPSGDSSLLNIGRRNLPGSLYTLKQDGMEECTRWFRPQYKPEYGVSIAEWGSRLAAVLRRSAARLKGTMNNPLLFLSGGLDSRLALAALSSEFSPHCVTLLDGENYETKTARMVAKAVGAAHYTITRDKFWYLRVMERTALLQGGSYHPAHSHFSEGLKKMGPEIHYDSVLLGDFLEAFQKLLGNKIGVLGKKPRPEDLCDHVLVLDGKYATYEKLPVLQYLQQPIRKRVVDAWRANLMSAATEALDVSRELSVSVDYFLRWSAAYEVATYGMIEDVRSVAPERSLSMDNEVYDLMLSIPSDQRKYGRISLEAIKLLNPHLSSIPNANTMLPASAPYWCHNAVKIIRPRIGAARQAFNRKFRITDSVMSSSWTDCRVLATSDKQWIEFIDDIFNDSSAFPDTIFNARSIQDMLQCYRSGTLSHGFSIDSLLTFGIIHKYFGSGELN